MDLFAALADFSSRESLPFIVVGGHAIIAHGYPRFTADLDIAIPTGDLPRWVQWLEAQGFRLRHATPAFQQYLAPPGIDWPVDLMMLDRSTFDKMWAGAVVVDLGGASLRVPDPRHLLAMKLHALRHGTHRRKSKDLIDVIELMSRHAIRADDAIFKELVQRYATPEIEAEIRRALGS